MKTSSFLGLCQVVFGTMTWALTASACADDRSSTADNVALLVGKWEVTEGSKGVPPPGAVVEFTKNGKIRITARIDQAETKAYGSYKLEGDKLQITLYLGQKEAKEDDFTITKISEDELILDGKGEAHMTCRRLK